MYSLVLSLPLKRQPDPVLDEYLQQYPEWVRLKGEKYEYDIILSVLKSTKKPPQTTLNIDRFS